MTSLPPSLLQLLHRRGFESATPRQEFLSPSLDRLASPEAFPHMELAVRRLRLAIQNEEPIAIYADRDVDGLAGLAILARSLRSLGGVVHWGSPLAGRGLERPVLERLVSTGTRLLILVDCGTNEAAELRWLAEKGLEVIIADHHRMPERLPEVLAWIHPGMRDGASVESPAGCVMAFKLAQALWHSFLGPSDKERLDYFCFDHLDLVALGILADRVPLVGENRVYVWHGLRRLAKTRKAGLAALIRFFRIGSAGAPVSVRQATWQIIPLLNAAGRLGQPHWTVDLLMTEDPWAARRAIDALLGLNIERRRAQLQSADHFERTVIEQCRVESDPVLIATARDLEPSVTGLAAQSLVEKYGRPAFLFVEQGENFVGSARGTPDVDLFSWVEHHEELLVKFGGHPGAVGLTVRKSDFPALREGLLKLAERQTASPPPPAAVPDGKVSLREADPSWWDALQSLEPFGPGFERPIFELTHVERIRPLTSRHTRKFMMRSGALEWPAQFKDSPSPSRGEGTIGPGPFTVIATPEATPKAEFPFQWIILEVR